MEQVVANATCPVYILASHVHADHFNPEVLGWKSAAPVRYLLSSDIRRRHKELRDDERIVWLRRGECFADGIVSVRTHGSTDVGVSFLIEVDGRRVFHAGDFNDWQRAESDDGTNRQMRGYFLAELAKMLPDVQHADAALFPVDTTLGPLIMSGPFEFCRQARPKLFLPMHCWGNYTAAEQAAKQVEDLGVALVTCRPGDEVEV